MAKAPRGARHGLNCLATHPKPSELNARKIAVRPIIAITCSTRLSHPTPSWLSQLEMDAQNRDYTKAVRGAGGTVLLLPCTEETEGIADILARVDGVILSGGHDLDPIYWSEEPDPKLEFIDVPRDALDKAVYDYVSEHPELPTLCVCWGMQVVNVFAGGTLYQDVSLRGEHQVRHRQQAPRDYGTHELRLEPESKLAQLAGATSIRVNSFHHQIIRELAPSLKPVGWAGDGTVEAWEKPEAAFSLGVQYHPEHMVDRYDHARNLFKAFVDACRRK